jgi:hypothetical protein
MIPEQETYQQQLTRMRDDAVTRARRAEADVRAAEDELGVLRRRVAELVEQRDEARTALALLHQGEEPYEDECIVPTPGQWIWRWNRATAEERLQRAEQVIADYTRLDRARQVLVFHGDRPGWQQAVRAALDGTAEQPTCCVCGTTEHGGRTFYENYKGHLFCGPCADGDRPSCPLGDQCHGVDCPRRADHGARPSLAAPHTCRQCEPTP